MHEEACAKQAHHVSATSICRFCRRGPAGAVSQMHMTDSAGTRLRMRMRMLGHLDLGIAPAFGKWVLTLYRAGSRAFGVCYAPMAVTESANAQSVARARCRLSSMPQAGCRYCIVLRAEMMPLVARGDF